ncbi:MAG: hypothetical protein F4Y49_03585 [Dehalococcoidia bacterium]|nr:hypothetical protein [Dehalococcoidia bacterium]
MTEAILMILALAVFAGMVASTVTVIIGFKSKRWRPAIISGSALGGLFIVFLIFAGATGQMEELENETDPAEQAVLPTAAPSSNPTPIAALIPNPTPIPPVSVGGLGVSRDEVQRRFEQAFQHRNLAFEASESTDGTPTAYGVFDNKRTGVILEGADELYEASLLFTIAGGSQEDFQDQMDAVFLLGDLVIPEWEGRSDWLHEVLAFLAEHDVADFETMQGDKRIAFSYAPSTAQALFTIELQSDVVLKSTPVPVSVGGLGISRAEAQESFEGIGYSFGPTISSVDGQPQTVAFGYSDKLMIVMAGADDNLVTGMVSGDIVDTPSETAIAMALLAQTLMPDEFESVVQWLTDTMTKITSDTARYMEKELVQTYGGRQLTFSTMSTELTGQVMFKIDSPANPIQTTEMRSMEPEFDCATVTRVYWLVRNVGDHQAAVLSVWDELVRTNPNADFGAETATRIVEECGIESP